MVGVQHGPCRYDSTNRRQMRLYLVVQRDSQPVICSIQSIQKRLARKVYFHRHSTLKQRTIQSQLYLIDL